MNRRILLATAVALLAMPAAALAARGPAVTVRVEGLHRTLLPATVVHARSGWITRYGAPRGECPAKSAQGALNVATHRRWRGIWSTEFGPEYEITSILGETHRFTSKYYWEIFADNGSASAGACELKLHRGEQLLFAAVPDNGTAYPLAIRAPRTATVGHAFTVKVVYFTGTGTTKPLAGATVSAAGRRGKTDSQGVISITASQAGSVVIHARDAGYIRAVPVTVEVS